MKKTILAISCFTLAVAAQAGTTPTTGPVQAGGQHSCHAIEQACKAAGFVRSGTKDGKGLFMNCLKPIMAGQSVNGVTVNPADVQACQAKHQRR